jgi:hypothetical protein
MSLAFDEYGRPYIIIKARLCVWVLQLCVLTRQP